MKKEKSERKSSVKWNACDNYGAVNKYFCICERKSNGEKGKCSNNIEQ